MKNLIVLSIIIVISLASLVQMFLKLRTIQTRIGKKTEENAEKRSNLFSEIGCKDIPQKRVATGAWHFISSRRIKVWSHSWMNGRTSQTCA